MTDHQAPVAATSQAAAVPLRWLDDAAPADLTGGVTWGVPLPRGAVANAETLTLLAGSQPVPVQTWPLAFWPDQSVKWLGVATAASATPAEAYRLDTGERVPPQAPLTVREGADEIEVTTGDLRVVVARSGDALLRNVTRAGTEVARNVRLVGAVAAECPDEFTGGAAPARAFAPRLDAAVVEQHGPVRAVVLLTGCYDGERGLFPFRVRFVFHAGSPEIRAVHTLTWDGDPEHDFITGLGLRADVPLRAAAHDRHVRIATADGGIFAEAVQTVTGLRRDPGEAVRHAQIAGLATPAQETWDPRVQGRMRFVPTWGDFTLTQLSADGYHLSKRTRAGFGWVDAHAGTRSEGLVSLSDPSGGFAIGQRAFWQSHPTQMDVRGAAGDDATLTSWLHAPSAPPMDLRFYHDGLGQAGFDDQLEALEITYEDYEPGFGTAHGIARTHELTLIAWDATPSVDVLAARVAAVQEPPLLQATPAHLHACGVFGDWSPVDRSTPVRAELETSLDTLLEFYLGETEQRRWYGFWHYGDVMHSYDRDRHCWKYDVGGFAWDNSELSPDLWLWYSYLRSGRADVFRFAEAMTRHTGEVDVYHAGRFAGLGTRHNVQHWGCSAKQLRISTPAYRRFLHYLTADERVGELLAELVDSDATFLGLDPRRKVRPDAATYVPDRAALDIGLGTDWSALAATWLTDWERTGNPRSRDRLLGCMEDIGALPHGFLTGEALYNLDTGRLDTTRERVSVSHLSAVFGLVEVCSELISLVDAPGFKAAWLDYCRLYLAPADAQAAELGAPLAGTHLEQAHSRLTAYAAHHLDDDSLRALAWQAFNGMGEWLLHRDELSEVEVSTPAVPRTVREIPSLGTNDASQYGLAAIQLLALLGDRLEELAG